MSTPEDVQRLLKELKDLKERAETAETRAQSAETRAETAETQAKLEKSRADELATRQAPTRLLDYIRHVDQNMSAAFTVEQSSSTSLGVTSVEGRFYPQHFQPWHDFAGTHNELFNMLVQTFANDGGAYFPSILSIETLGGDISPAAADEQDLRPFIRASIEKPAALIVSKYLEIVNHPAVTAIRFRNNAYGLNIGRSEEQLQQQLEEEQQQQQRGRPRKRRSPARAVGVPDRWAVASNRDGEKTHVLVAEYKAAHRLPAKTLRPVMSAPPTDNFFPRAAKQDETSTSSAAVPGSVLVAKVLCQAYHYMITSGLEFGYVASGEGLVLLRILERDPNTLYYFWSVFPSQNAANDNPPTNVVLRAPRDTAMAYLASLSILGIDSTPRPSEWIDAAKRKLKRWPGPKKAAAPLSDTFSLLPPPHKDGHDDSGGGGGGGGSGSGVSGGESSSSGLAGSVSLRLVGTQSALKRSRGSEPAGGHQTTTTAAPAPSTPFTRPFVVEPPTLPYCTQACLQGLLHGGLPLDKQCPNVKLHGGAGSFAVEADSHVLTAREVRALVVAQLAKNMDKDCECLDKYGCFGRFGVLFKITVTGYGYTLVAKGVQRRHRSVLEREAAVYRGLQSFQGRLIPVCLGLLDLERSVPLHSCACVSHMLLLSYVGPDLGVHSFQTKKALFPSGVDWAVETERTWDELAAAGLQDNDRREQNVAWNDEVGRVMQFDFDQAFIPVPSPVPSPNPSPGPLRSSPPPPRSPLLAKRDLNAYQHDENEQNEGLQTKKRPRTAT
ncbi:metalloprotease m41 [Niveomyces insectorum RCEF 264]|uniref:Metalloprotease m41 n=1 Tax=Niveomyces insectorum RCEF 264 TaxID=1081102 RepID=A0A167WB77_9HYPO|nr:metalloprotease m41 [Niveomyces insectorum RCEF 264]